MRSQPFSIGRLVAASGCKVPSIRYYKAAGLLPRPERTPGNQRRYIADDRRGASHAVRADAASRKPSEISLRPVSATKT